MSSPEADLLKVSAQAGLDEIKKAYRRAALVHHPDHNPDPHAARHFRRLTEAYRLLADQAQRREPPKPPKPISPADRLAFLLGDVRAMVRRWPAARWTRVVDGLPTVVWVAGALDVVAQTWPGLPATRPVTPTVEGIVESLDDWPDRMAGWPLAAPLPRQTARALDQVLATVELRLRALDRPARRPSK